MLLQFHRNFRLIRPILSILQDSGRSATYKSKKFQTFRFLHPIISGQHFSTVTSQNDDEPAVILPHTPSSSSSFRQKSIDRKEIQEDRDPKILLGLIIEKLGDNGKELILPDSYLENLEQSSLRLLLNEGRTLRMNYIADAFAARPKLFEISASKWESLLKVFRDADLSAGILLAAAVGNPKIFELEPKEINETLIQLGVLGVSGRILSAVIAKRPQVLTMDIDRIYHLIEQMNSFFPRQKLLIMIRRDPDILFEDFEKLEAKYEYVYNSMGLEPLDLYKSRMWHKISLAMIECRHQFLVRCGVYIMPSEKKTEVAADNPRLFTILDTNDEEFCRLANVGLLEWEIFKKIYQDEEPSEHEWVDVPFLRRTGRTAAKEEDEEEWEDVDVEEIIENEKNARLKEEDRKTQKRKKGRDRAMKNDTDRDRDRDRTDQRTASKDPRRRYQDGDHSAPEGRQRKKKSDQEERIYARSLSEKELGELNAKLGKMQVQAAGGYRDEEEDEDEDYSDDEEYQEYERRRMKKQERQRRVMKQKDKEQFRKRGSFLASED